MDKVQIINLTPDTIQDYGVCGYKDVKKHLELRNKIEWFKEYYPKGLRIKVIMSDAGGYQGMLEYIPGELAHRPVNAHNYMFIHCLFVGFKNEFKGRGYASMLLNECIVDAKNRNMSGVAVVTRKGSFMADKDIFLKKGFRIVDGAKPDFNLLALSFDSDSKVPCFKSDILNDITAYKNGLTIIRSVQCPYTEKNVQAIIRSANKLYGIKVNLVDLKDSQSAQHIPCAFGTFCIIYQGEILSHHPISNKRFENIMSKINH